ncbi:hypothetical protein HPP92_022817 [Vanilla planifolia]|uniref:Uncharacterized protein n=1 Tax=Vanilla planifolia TaxID=51239 RepID=A0A835PY51_VANPL|nr:hypothetical protein HPP92_022817 [Vanilla planifolia]
MAFRSKKKKKKRSYVAKSKSRGADLDLLSCPLSFRKRKALGAEIKLKTTLFSRVHGFPPSSNAFANSSPSFSSSSSLRGPPPRFGVSWISSPTSEAKRHRFPHHFSIPRGRPRHSSGQLEHHGCLHGPLARRRMLRRSGDVAVPAVYRPPGPLDALSQLDELRLIDLHGNRLNGTLMNLLPCLPKLKLLYLSSNDLSGEIPSEIGRLNRLLRLDLANNNFDGSIPGEAFSNLTRLLTLRLQNNLLSGLLPDLANALPRLVELNVSNNQLSGRLPDAVRVKFGLEAVAGNAGLCGPTPPLLLCSFIPRDSPPSISSSPSAQSVVPSNLSSIPHSPTNASIINGAPGSEKRVRENLSTGAIIGISVANAVFFLLLLLLLAFCCCAGPLGENDGKVDAEDEQKEDYKRSSAGSYSNDEDKNSKAKAKKKKADRNSSESDDGSIRSQLVFFDQTEEEEEALLRGGNGVPFGRKARNKIGGKGGGSNSRSCFEHQRRCWVKVASARCTGRLLKTEKWWL